MTWTIRRMNESDIDTIYAIERSVHIVPWSKNSLRDCVLAGYNCVVLEVQVEKKPLVIGFMICRHNNGSCHILNFCIAKEFQLQGYGRQFLQHMLQVITQMNTVKRIVLEVRPSNRIALHLYESMGFEQVEIKPDYYKDSHSTEDAIFLKKVLHF